MICELRREHHRCGARRIAYNSTCPHLSPDMAAPASLFRIRADGEPASAGDVAEDAPPRPGITGPAGATTLGIGLTVPPSSVVVLTGAQQVWVGKAFAGRTVTLCADLTSAHVLLGRRSSRRSSPS